MKLKIGKLTIDIQITWEKKYINQVKDALREGHKLEAIRIYKTATGLGLKESKDIIDAMCPKYYQPNQLAIELAKFQAEQFNK